MQQSPMTVPASSISPLTAEHTRMANAIRALAMDAVEQANSGHPGMPMGMADVATVLFARHLKYDPTHPEWPDRDRFVLSAGHGSMLLYALLHLTGYADMTLEELKRFRQIGAKTAGHPEFGHAMGIETTTGPLGQGFANAVGMALAERMLNARFGDETVGHYTYAIAGDGCLMEGITHEAASLAGHLRLSKLIVMFDDNGITIDGSTKLTVSEDTLARFRAYGWNTSAVDGHDAAAIDAALSAARKADRPTLIACKTVIGFGAPTKGGTEKTHGSPLGATEIEGARVKLDWAHAPFELPPEVLKAWRTAGARGNREYREWQARYEALAPEKQALFEGMLSRELPADLAEKLAEFKQAASVSGASEATRKSSERVLEVLNPLIPALVGGSADLTGSNNTKTKGQQPVTAEHFGGQYIYYGVREHGMAAIMNGLALHGGFIPYGGTFLVFSDYCRPSIRLSALMGQQVVYVMTHDSIGLGEDGPTHQPVEHLASLRAIPGLHVYRPADAVETAECWESALIHPHNPSLLCLSRQNLPVLRTEHVRANRSLRGAYVLRDCQGEPQVTLIASGSEVALAVEAQKALAEKKIAARVVSMPCWELFDGEDAEYRNQVIAPKSIKVAIEAATGFGWERYIGADGIFIGMHGFGASGPAPELYKHFGITVENIVKQVMQRVTK